MPGKRVQFDDETWHALDLLARDRMQDFQELADEAFRDLLIHAVQSGNDNHAAIKKGRSHAATASLARPASKSAH